MKIILALLLLIPSLSFGVELKPISQIIKERDMNDKATYLYIVQRCAGLNFLNTTNIKDTNPELVDEMNIKTETFLQLAKYFNKRYGTIPDEELTNIVTQETKKFYDLYFKLFENNWYENGAYFEGTWI
jgi:hypothetical protein